ncbi:hypothetical protein B2J96_09925 [Mycobacterium shigaense]|nr:hypothetical protein [Mycobacterium shigaense]MEA1122804.1 hypothetical protein [Mycobacterium shigaense]PRI15413.1 hypothetical protein B2J96_09925 [Mycobacterium shigaense]
MNKVHAVLAIVLLVGLAVLAIPIKARCGAPGLSCASALDTRGYVHYYYEIEPLGIFLAEIVTRSNIEIFYRSGEDLEKVR